MQTTLIFTFPNAFAHAQFVDNMYNYFDSKHKPIIVHQNSRYLELRSSIPYIPIIWIKQQIPGITITEKQTYKGKLRYIKC